MPGAALAGVALQRSQPDDGPDPVLDAGFDHQARLQRAGHAYQATR